MIIPEPISTLQEKLRSGQHTCLSIVERCLDRLEKGQDLNAYVHVFRDEAIARAKAYDQKFAKFPNKMGRLWGVVISIKDVISYRDHPLTAGSKILRGYQPVYSATAVERLLAEDAIIIGTTNCDEFAMGSDNRNSSYGPVANAAHPDHVPGGSSGGAAVSVQMGSCQIALGSDTGGSVRQPAAFCNLVGFKPTYGQISRHGLIAYASSFDQIGIVGHFEEDVELVYDLIKGPDQWDSTTFIDPPEEGPGHGRKRLAYIEEAMTHDGLQAEIRESFFAKVKSLTRAGWIVEPISLNHFDYIIPTYYVLTSAEASSNLSRYDGIKFGYRSDQGDTLQEMYTHTRSEGFGAEVKRRILLGTFVLSVGYYDAYFAKAQKVRRLLKDQFDAWFNQYHGILLPTTPTVAWKKDEHLSPVQMYLADIYSVLANLIGSPSISIPLGQDGAQLSFGAQIISKPGADNTCIALARAIKNVE